VINNHYINVFFEAFHTASIIPLSSEATMAAMKAFGGFNLTTALALAIAGGILGQMFNWWLGSFLIKKRPANGWNIPDTLYEKARHIFNKYLVFLLIFCWLPLGNFFMLAAGFLGAKPKMIFPLLLIGYAVHYAVLN
jgi:membrane protein YqaA with SNARE-associated domain